MDIKLSCFVIDRNWFWINQNDIGKNIEIALKFTKQTMENKSFCLNDASKEWNRKMGSSKD